MFEEVIQLLQNQKSREVIVVISECLKNAEQQQKRDLAAEEILAEAASRALHKHDNADFMLCASVKAKGMFETTGYPQSWTVGRPELTRYGSPYLTRSRENSVNTYCYGFYRGDILGYLKELGQRWVLLLGDSSGFRYIPVADLTAVDGTSY